MPGKPLQFPETQTCDIDKEKSIATSRHLILPKVSKIFLVAAGAKAA